MDFPHLNGSIGSEDESTLVNLHPLPIEDLHAISPRQVSGKSPPQNLPETTTKYFSVIMGISERRERRRSRINVARRRWQQAILKARTLSDPWGQFHLDKYQPETAVRYRYNTFTKEWLTDDVVVKMEPQPFSHGAMRECFRLKKLSNFSHSHNWKTASNYVAKRYMEDVDRQVYLEDVRLQMDAKLWGEEFNRHNPPKKVDIMQVAVLEFIEREGRPLYHLEHFIEGDYIKYNSNSGYVSDEKTRQTPQAFSHFTFERSGHELLVVDIQGVGDLYTDPQIHTASGKEYNDGNLGTRGMALFFHSHHCNFICESLGLSRFDLGPTELALLIQPPQLLRQCSDTRVRGTEELCISPAEHNCADWHELVRPRSGSLSSMESLTSRHRSSHNSYSSDDAFSLDSGFDSNTRNRYLSESGSVTKESERLAFHEMVAKKSRPSCVHHEVQCRLMLSTSGRKTGGSILGKVHLELTKYHELCRFTQLGDDNYDREAAMFHLRHAADCGDLEAIICLARMYHQLPHDILVDIGIPASKENLNMGVDYLVIAAEAGDRASMLHMAKAYDTGLNLGTERQRSWKEATYWYSRAINMDDQDESGQYDGCMDDPKYQLLARQAELYLEGGYGLERDVNTAAEMFQEAAEAAMGAAKGRLANKYYAMAEEAWGQAEE